MHLKFWNRIAAILLCPVLLAGCGASAQEAPGTADSVPVHTDSSGAPVLRVGFAQDSAPYCYSIGNSREMNGFDVELAEALCEDLGWTLEAVRVSPETQEAELLSGHIDCLIGWSDDGSGDAPYALTAPYMDQSVVAVVQKDSSLYELKDLIGMTSVTADRSPALDALIYDPGDGSNDRNIQLAAAFYDLYVEPDYSSCFQQLEEDDIESVIAERSFALYAQKQSEVPFRILEEPIKTDCRTIAFADGESAVCRAVSESLAHLLSDGTAEMLSRNFISWRLEEILLLPEE